MHWIRRFLSAVIGGNKLKVRDLQNNCNRDMNTCSQFRVTISKKILYVLQKTSKMQFYIFASVILYYVFLFHTHTEARWGVSVFRPIKVSVLVKLKLVLTSYVISRRLWYTGVQTAATFVNCVYKIRTTQHLSRLGAPLTAKFPKQPAIQSTIMAMALFYVKVGDPRCDPFLAKLTIYTSRDYSSSLIIYSFVLGYLFLGKAIPTK